MQLNEGLEMLDDINIERSDDDIQNMANTTANKFLLYSMLDEFKLNDNPAPTILNVKIQRTKGYVGLGFVSHIFNETRGLVYMLDVMSMPDPSILFGANPKPLMHTPRSGEMFGYLFQNKYLVRATRVQYESNETIDKNQYSAMLMDIGCEIRIDINPNGANLFEVTEEARSTPSFATMINLLNIPTTLTISDLLHLRVQYKVLCNEGGFMLVDILNDGVDPFVHPNDPNLYMYFMQHNLPPNKRDRKRKAVNLKSRAAQVPNDVHESPNSITDSQMYGIEKHPSALPPNKANTFDFDPVNDSPVMPKSSNIQVTKIVDDISHNVDTKWVKQRTAPAVPAARTVPATPAARTERAVRAAPATRPVPAVPATPANMTTNKHQLYVPNKPERGFGLKTVGAATPENFANFDRNVERYFEVKQAKTSGSSADLRLNPFADPQLYEIKNVPLIPLTDKTNPFYYGSAEDIPKRAFQQKCVNFQVTKILTKPSNQHNKYRAAQQNKKFDNQRIVEENEPESPNSCGALKMEKRTPNQQIQEKPAKIDRNVVLELEPKSVVSSVVKAKQMTVDPLVDLAQDATDAASKTPNEKISTPTHNEKVELVQPLVAAAPMAKPEQAIQSTVCPQKVQPMQLPIGRADFVQPQNLPSIGDSITILYQHMVSVEEFYGVMCYDPCRDGLEVSDFTILLNSYENSKRFVQYSQSCKPKLNDKVIALYEESYYRAKVVKVIDEHVYQVHYVDYGNCAKVSTLHMFKYDEQEWDEYPVYAMHFRINGIHEINPYDYQSKRCLELIMASECKATIVDIKYCDKIQRTTYIVDLEDENGLNIASTLINKNLACFEKPATHPSIS